MTKKTNEDVFEAQVAGSFYSQNKFMLEKELQTYFQKTKIDYNNQEIKALIVPHAGYKYSGQTAMYGYKMLYYDLLLRKEDDYKIIVLAPSHKQYFKDIKILSSRYYKTPLGKTNIYTSEKLEEYTDNNVFLEEHSIEVQLPFIDFIFNKVNKNYEVLPILVGEIEDLNQIARNIGQEIDNKTIVIISSDLSHFLEYDKAISKDKQTITKILSKEPEEIDACGKNPIIIYNEIAKKQNLYTKELNYTNSGEIIDKSSVVGYASIAYYNDLEKHLLIRLAEKVIYNKLHNQKENLKDLKEIMPEEYLQKQGVFVTVYKNKDLRGCIGNIIGTETIFDSILKNSVNAGFRDPRFTALTKQELKDITIEISILSVPVVCSLEDINKGDGVIIEKEFNSAVYLPQVWDLIEDKDLFLSSLCEKAGLNKECYKSNVVFKKFNVDIIE
jgi:MEMO1 family protein